MDWYPRRPQSYRNDTWGLTLAEHGAYCLLLDYYYSSECPLPSDDSKLASIIGCSLDDWLLVKQNVTRYFRVSNAHLTHMTCDEVIERSLGRRNDGLQRQLKYRKRLDTVTRNKRVSNAPRGEERIVEDRIEESNHAPPDGGANVTERPAKGKSNGSGQKRGTRISADWNPDADDREVARTEGYTDQQIDRLVECFRDYWISQPGNRGCKLDWKATWRNYVRGDIARKQVGGFIAGRGGQNASGTVAAARRLIDRHRRNSEQ